MNRRFAVCLALIAASIPAAANATPPAFGTPVRAITRCASSCFEPSVAVDLSGRIFVADSRGIDLSVSEDGVSFSKIVPPPMPGDHPQAERNEAIVQIDRAGRLVYSALVFLRQSNAYFVVNVGYGIQYARSADGGATWEVNTLIALETAPSSLANDADRQWVAFGLDPDEVYVSWQGNAPVWGFSSLGVSFQAQNGLWIARSTDGGRTFPTATMISHLPGDRFLPGQPIVDPAGTLYYPFFKNSQLDVARSTDKAATFKVLKAADLQGMPVYSFPSLTIAPEGTLYLSFKPDDNGIGYGSVMVTRSPDQGAHWALPADRWTLDGEVSYASPWADARADGALDVLYFLPNQDRSASDLWFSRADVENQAIERTLVASAIPGLYPGSLPVNTSFAHFARLMDGRAIVVWAEPASIWVSIER